MYTGKTIAQFIFQFFQSVVDQGLATLMIDSDVFVIGRKIKNMLDAVTGIIQAVLQRPQAVIKSRVRIFYRAIGMGNCRENDKHIGLQSVEVHTEFMIVAGVLYIKRNIIITQQTKTLIDKGKVSLAKFNFILCGVQIKQIIDMVRASVASKPGNWPDIYGKTGVGERIIQRLQEYTQNSLPPRSSRLPKASRSGAITTGGDGENANAIVS